MLIAAPLILFLLGLHIFGAGFSSMSGRSGSSFTPPMSALAWGLSLSWLIAWIILTHRTQAAGLQVPMRFGSPPRALRLLMRFVFVPLCIVMLATVLVLTAVPVLQLATMGEAVSQPAQIEKLGTVHDYPVTPRQNSMPGRVRTCFTTIRVTIPTRPPRRSCIKEGLYHSLKPGDGLLYRYVIYGDFYRMTFSRLPAAEMPSDLGPDPRLAPYLSKNSP